MSTLPPNYPPTRVCFTCQEDLPASAYTKGNTIKYFRCKLCERKRLAEYRRKVKETQVMVDITCIACRDVVTGDKVAKTGKYAMKICTICYYKFKQHRKPHHAELADGICMRCEMYGASSNCIVDHKVDLDE
jgi:hypothetical protein